MAEEGSEFGGSTCSSAATAAAFIWPQSLQVASWFASVASPWGLAVIGQLWTLLLPLPARSLILRGSLLPSFSADSKAVGLWTWLMGLKCQTLILVHKHMHAETHTQIVCVYMCVYINKYVWRNGKAHLGVWARFIKNTRIYLHNSHAEPFFVYRRVRQSGFLVNVTQNIWEIKWWLQSNSTQSP